MRRIGLAGQTLVAVVVGLGVAWVDSRPHWDDTGIIAVTIFVACALLGTTRPRLAWLWALAVGLWLPLENILLHHNYPSLLALVFAFAGAYAGAFVRQLLWHRGDVAP